MQLTHLIKNDEGKLIFNGTINTCEKKAFSYLIRLMRSILGHDVKSKPDEFIPAPWFCPIRKVSGISINFIFDDWQVSIFRDSQ